jgi:site-specific DNA-methyltransferase (adenine-specific)
MGPFMGSGSTLKAAVLEGFDAIGIELEEEHVEIATRRVDHALNQVAEAAAAPRNFELFSEEAA